MKVLYPTLFTKTKKEVLIEVPDLGILSQGKDIKNAYEMARDAIEVMLVEMEDEGERIPAPSEIIDVTTGTFSSKGETLFSYVYADPTEYRRKIDTKAVRRNVTLPNWLNYEAERAGINVSKVLQDALISVLGITKKY